MIESLDVKSLYMSAGDNGEINLNVTEWLKKGRNSVRSSIPHDIFDERIEAGRFYSPDEDEFSVAGNGKKVVKSNTPTYELGKGDKQSSVQELAPGLTEPPTVVPYFSQEVREEILEVVSSIIQRQDSINEVSERLRSIGTSGGNSQGFLHLTSFSHVENNGKLFIPKGRMLKILADRLNINVSVLEPGIHNYLDFSSIVYQVLVEKSGFLNLDKTFSVELGVHVPKI